MADFKSIIDKGKSFWLGIGAWLREKLHPVQQRYVAFKTEKPRSALAFKITFVSALSGILFLFIFCLMIYLGAFGRLPNYGELKQIQHNVASEVYSDDGVLLGKYYVENRINADFEEISPNIINALVATEDVRFFEHSGIDFRAWIRVFFRTLLMQDASGGGGSTLSQQLAKNVFPRQRLMLFTTPIAKVKEMFIARRLENIYSKQELLNLYLNTVPFSENIFGVKVASQRFFNTSP
jgi:penicillin-binding protein 1A